MKCAPTGQLLNESYKLYLKFTLDSFTDFTRYFPKELLPKWATH